MIHFPSVSAGALVFMAAAIVAPAAAHAQTAACAVIERNLEVGRSELAAPQLSAMLFAAADAGCVAIVPKLMAAGASAAARDRTGGTALTHAARAGRAAMVPVLLGNGADINQRDVLGATPLSVAIETNHNQVAIALIEAGADITLTGRSGITPLIAAAYNGNRPVVDILLQHKADVAVIDSTGKSAIVYAAARGFTPIVARLLDAGVDVNAVYANRLTALSWAAGHADDVPESEAATLVTRLLDRGAKPDIADDRGETTLMIAAEMGHDDVAGILLAHGADPSLRNKAGQTARDLTRSPALRAKLSGG